MVFSKETCKYVNIIPLFLEADYKRYRDFPPVMLFELFFDEKLISLIVEQSTVYCMSKNWANINVTCDEIQTFLAILIVSCYNTQASKSMYWSTG